MIKLNKQIRWLLFIIIPFVVLLIIHFLIPLEIAINSFPKIGSSYNLQKIQEQLQGFISCTAANKLILQNIMRTYTKITEISLSTLSGSKPLYFSQNKESFCTDFSIASNISITLINNYSTPNSSYPCKSLKDSSTFILLEYIDKLQGYFKSTLDQQQNGSILSLKILVESEFKFFGFEQVSTVSNSFNNTYIISNYQLLYNFLQQLTANDQKHGIKIFKISQESTNMSSLLLCEAILRDGLKCIACIEIDLLAISKQIQEGVQHLQKGITNINTLFTISLPSAASRNISPQVIYSRLNGSTTNIIPFTHYQSIFPLFSFSLLNSDNSQFISNPQLINLEYKKYQALHMTPIYISDYENQSIPMYLLNQFTITTSYETVMSTFNNSFQTLAIMVGFATFIFSTIAALILKYLLDGIDQQTSQLENKSRFILEDDTQIQIPQYFGTKDIRQVYDKVRIINKLHRFSNYHYFNGHPAQKILRYTEALQCIRLLRYDAGNIYENLGEAYLQLEDWEKSTQFFKLSIKTVLEKIEVKFGDMDEIVRLKTAKKISYGYKELQIILIRRLFKLVLLYFRYFEFHQVKSDNALHRCVKPERQQIMKIQSAEYSCLLKKAFYPYYSNYAESIIALIYECKLASNLKREAYCKSLIPKIDSYIRQYAAEYDWIGKKLKEKGSKHKYFQLKNKMTSSSRTHPQLLSLLWNLFKAKIMMSSITSPEELEEILQLYFEGVKSKFMNSDLAFIFAIDVKNILIDLNLVSTLSKLEATHLFRQALPLKALFYEQASIESYLRTLKPAIKGSLGLQRQFIFVIDCLKSPTNSEEKAKKYFYQQSQHVFDSLIKEDDRISIIKFNTNIGMKIECKLILKGLNQEILKKEVVQSFDEIGVNKTSLIELEEMLTSTLNRIKRLQSEKVILFYLRSSKCYEEGIKNKKLSKKIFKLLLIRKQTVEQQLKISRFGEIVVKAMETQGLRNIKLIFCCSKKDKLEQFRDFFGFRDINKRIWSTTSGINIFDKTVYIIEQGHKSDIDAILMPKYEEAQDNNIFIL